MLVVGTAHAQALGRARRAGVGQGMQCRTCCVGSVAWDSQCGFKCITKCFVQHRTACCLEAHAKQYKIEVGLHKNLR